jgi:hypothetical protein
MPQKSKSEWCTRGDTDTLPCEDNENNVPTLIVVLNKFFPGKYSFLHMKHLEIETRTRPDNYGSFLINKSMCVTVPIPFSFVKSSIPLDEIPNSACFVGIGDPPHWGPTKYILVYLVKTIVETNPAPFLTSIRIYGMM